MAQINCGSAQVLGCVRAMLMGVLLVLGSCSGPQPPVLTDTSPAETVVVNFYRWYLAELKAHREPTDNHATLARYVDPALVKLIEENKRQEQIAGEMILGKLGSSDYFLKTQDFGDAWAEQLRVSPRSVADGTAVLEVMLGTADFSSHLSVTVKRDALREWKISEVQSLR